MAKETIYPAWVHTLKTAATDQDVHAFDGLMQGIAPRRGFKVKYIKGSVGMPAAAVTDLSEIYITLMKNIAEGLHHTDPASAGEATENTKSGIFYVVFKAMVGGELSYEWFFQPNEPIEFDADDRFNINLTFNNKDAAESSAIFRMQAQIELQ